MSPFFYIVATEDDLVLRYKIIFDQVGCNTFISCIYCLSLLQFQTKTVMHKMALQPVVTMVSVPEEAQILYRNYSLPFIFPDNMFHCFFS